jgi:hypothetical protein
VLWIDPRASYMLDKLSTTELHPQPRCFARVTIWLLYWGTLCHLQRFLQCMIVEFTPLPWNFETMQMHFSSCHFSQGKRKMAMLNTFFVIIKSKTLLNLEICEIDTFIYFWLPRDNHCQHFTFIPYFFLL